MPLAQSNFHHFKANPKLSKDPWQRSFLPATFMFLLNQIKQGLRNSILAPAFDYHLPEFLAIIDNLMAHFSALSLECRRFTSLLPPLKLMARGDVDGDVDGVLGQNK